MTNPSQASKPLDPPPPPPHNNNNKQGRNEGFANNDILQGHHDHC